MRAAHRPAGPATGLGREPGGPALHAGQKLLGALVGLGLLPLLTQLAITPFGAWPAWTWLATAIAGFVAPDLALAHKAARRRRELLSGLGTATEFLALAVAAGCGLEQALAEAATAGHGPFFTELARRLALARLQGQSGVDATAQLAADIDLPELAALAGACRRPAAKAPRCCRPCAPKPTPPENAAASGCWKPANAPR